MNSQGHQDDRAGTFRDLFDSTDEHEAVLEGRPPGAPAPTNSGVLDIRHMARVYERHRTEQAADLAEIAVPPMSSSRLGTVLPPLDEERAPSLATPGVVALSVALVVATACATIAIMVALGFRLAPTATSGAGTAFASDLPAPGTPVPATVPEGVPASVPLVHSDLDEIVVNADGRGVGAAAAASTASAETAVARPTAAAAPSASPRPARDARLALAARSPGPRGAAPPPSAAPPPRRRAATPGAAAAPSAAGAPSAAAAPTASLQSPTSSPAAPALGAAPAPETAPTACDAVMCLVDPNAPCCQQERRARDAAPTATPTATATAELPSKLSSRDVNAGIAAVRGRLLSCGDRHGFTGTVRLRLTIGPDGDVERSGVASGPDAFRDCVSEVAEKARFAKTQRGLTVYYPLVFR